jgi:pyrroline-5-carboxylate reductase
VFFFTAVQMHGGIYTTARSIMNKSIAFIGAGNMAGAIIGGIIAKSIASPAQLKVYDVNPAASARFAAKSINAAGSASEAADFADILFMSVKPQNYDEVLSAINGHTDGKVIVSIAAGISTDYIRARLGHGSRVVRVMPNTPLLLGYGATAISRCETVSDEEFSLVKEIFQSGGIVEVLPESQMNSVIAVNGSSPAYVYLFAKALIDGAAQSGIDAEAAKRLVCQTLIGSAHMLTDSGKTPDELITMVSSKGGTTIAALDALYDHDFEKALKEAMERCTKRAEELGK